MDLVRLALDLIPFLGLAYHVIGIFHLLMKTVIHQVYVECQEDTEAYSTLVGGLYVYKHGSPNREAEPQKLVCSTNCYLFGHFCCCFIFLQRIPVSVRLFLCICL